MKYGSIVDCSVGCRWIMVPIKGTFLFCSVGCVSPLDEENSLLKSILISRKRTLKCQNQKTDLRLLPPHAHQNQDLTENHSFGQWGGKSCAVSKFLRHGNETLAAGRVARMLPLCYSPPPQQLMVVCSLILLKSPHFQSNMLERSRNWTLRYTARNVHHLSTMFIFSVNAAYHKQQKATRAR